MGYCSLGWGPVSLHITVPLFSFPMEGSKKKHWLQGLCSQHSLEDLLLAQISHAYSLSPAPPFLFAPQR